MLSEIRLRNFKGFGDEMQTAPLGRRLTLIYGPNSGGKSSIIQALLMIKQSLQSRFVIARGELVDLASFKNIINGHDIGKKVEIGFSAEPDREEITWHKDINNEINVWDEEEEVWNKSKINVKFVLVSKNNVGVCSNTVINMNSLGTNMYKIDNYENHKEKRDKWYKEFFCSLYPPENYNKSKGEYYITNRTLEKWCTLTNTNIKNINIDKLKNYVIDGKINGFLPSRESRHLDNDINKDNTLENIIINSANIIRSNFMKIKYMGPFRIPPKRYYENTHNTAKTEMKKDGENAVLQLYVTNDNFNINNTDAAPGPIRELNTILNAIGINYSVKVDKVHDDIIDITGELLCMSLERDGVKVSPQDIGFGISQIMPILIQGVISNNSIIVVEQPELHIHPLLAANLAEYFLYNSYKNNNQWIIETHNPNMAARIQRIIRNKKFTLESMDNIININSHDINVLFVEKDEIGRKVSEHNDIMSEAEDIYTSSIVRHLGFNLVGDIDEWPKSFIEVEDVIAKYSKGT